MSTRSSTDRYTPTHTTAPAAAMAYEELKSLVLMGDVPIGLRLREERIAERLGISRTPVREALLRLHAERFLERHPEGGFRVLAPSGHQIRDLYEVRRALELFALRRGCDGGYDRLLVSSLRDDWRALDPVEAQADPEFVLLDEDFHVRLAEAAGNSELVAGLRSVNERIRTVRMHDFVTAGRIGITVEQHLAIVDAVLSRRSGRATDLLHTHIVQSQTVVEAAVGQVLERMLSIGERDAGW